MFYQLCSTGNYTQHHSCTRCRVSPPHSQFRLRWVLWQTNNFTVLGQTSSQTETAVGQQPDQFWSCYGGLYIFILCSLSVRLFFLLHVLSALLAKPLLLLHSNVFFPVRFFCLFLFLLQLVLPLITPCSPSSPSLFSF